MALWWLQSGWKDGLCCKCGAKIWPEGDPDSGMCDPCFSQHIRDQKRQKAEERAEAAYWRAQEFASYCAPWFDPDDPLNQP